MQDLQETMAADDCKLNLSRFYVKNNKVIDNVAEIEKREDINDYTYKMAAKNKEDEGEKDQFTGTYVKRKIIREDDPEPTPDSNINKSEAMGIPPSEENEETLREKRIRIFKHNSSRLLHERNKYVFLASVAEDAISLALVAKYNLSEMVGFILIKKLFFMIGELKEVLELKKNSFNLGEWDEYIDTKDFGKIYVYISKEYDVFKVYYNSMHDNVQKNSEKDGFDNTLVFKALKAEGEKELTEIFSEILLNYSNIIIKAVDNHDMANDKKKWVHLNQIMDCLNLDQSFEFQTNDKQFNFKLFYEEFNQRSLQEIIDTVKSKMAVMCDQYGFN